MHHIAPSNPGEVIGNYQRKINLNDYITAVAATLFFGIAAVGTAESINTPRNNARYYTSYNSVRAPADSKPAVVKGSLEQITTPQTSTEDLAIPSTGSWNGADYARWGGMGAGWLAILGGILHKIRLEYLQRLEATARAGQRIA